MTFLNILSTYYYHKLINIVTRDHKQSSTLLDNIYTNIPDCYDTGSSGVLRFLTKSDHYPIWTVRNNVLPSEQIKYITKRIHNQQNIALFRKRLKSSNWNKTNISIVYNLYGYYSTILSFKFSVRKDKNDIKIRDNYTSRRKVHQLQKIILKIKYTKNTNLSKQREAERDYYHEQFVIHKNDLKKFMEK